MVGLAVPFTKALGLYWYFALSVLFCCWYCRRYSPFYPVVFPSLFVLILSVLLPSQFGYILYPIPSVWSYLHKLVFTFPDCKFPALSFSLLPRLHSYPVSGFAVIPQLATLKRLILLTSIIFLIPSLMSFLSRTISSSVRCIRGLKYDSAIELRFANPEKHHPRFAPATIPCPWSRVGRGLFYLSSVICHISIDQSTTRKSPGRERVKLIHFL